MRRIIKRLFCIKVLAVLSILGYIVSLIPIYAASVYAFPQADDWSYSYHTRLAWVDTHSFLEVLKGAVTAVAEAYVNWQGTFSSIFLMSLQPGIWGERFYAAVPFIMTGLLTLSVIFFLNQVLRGADRNCRVIFSMAALWLITQEMVCKPAAFYWYNGAAHYIVPFCFFLMLVACILGNVRAEKKKNSYFLLSIFFAFMLGGGNLVTALLTVICFFFAAAFLIFLKKREKLLFVMVPGLINAAAFLANVLAPGNWLRQDVSGDPSNPVLSVLRSFYYGFFYIGEWTDETVLLVVLLLIPFMYRIVRQSKFHFPLPGLVAAFCFCLLSSMFTPSDYAVHTVNIGRVQNIIFSMYILLLLLNVLYLIGWYVNNRKEDESILQKDVLLKKEGICFYCLFAVFLFNIALVAVAEPQRFTSVLAIEELSDGTAEKFGEAAWNNIQILKEDGTEAVIAEVPKESLLLTSRDDIDQWHYGAKLYFRKDKVTVVKQEIPEEFN